MTPLLVRLSLVFGITNLAIAMAVVGNRLVVRRQERRKEELSRRVKPLLLEWLDGDEIQLSADQEERQVFADLLVRFGRALRGEGLDRVADLAMEVGLSDDLRRGMKSRRWYTRAAAAYRMGDLGTGDLAGLVAGLGDGERAVRNAAARSLGKLGGSPEVEPLVRALTEGRIARAIAGCALIDIGPPAVPALVELLGAESSQVRAIAAELLGRLGTASNGTALLEVLDDPEPEVRVAAVRGLGRLGSRTTAAALPALLDDPVPYVRAAAATSIGQLGEVRLAGRLGEMACRDEFVAARAAAEALAQLDPLAAETVAVETGSPHLVEAVDLLRAG
jgi:HEAT repeat protein